MKKTLKVLVWVVALSLCFTVLLTGCTKTPKTNTDVESSPEEAGPGDTSAEEPVTLTMWHNFGADAETPYFDDTIISMFEEAYPNITVEVVDQGTDQYNELITTSIVTNSLPDVARMDPTQVPGFANQGALVALDQFTDYAETAAGLAQGFVDATVFQGQHYALPLNTDCKAAVCNMNVMADLGFTEPPATMEEFINACQTYKPGEPMLNVSSTADWDFYPYIWWFGGSVTDDAYTTADGYINGPDTITAINKLKELHDDGLFTIAEIDGTPDAWDGIRTDQYAMFLEGPWFFPATEGWEGMNLKPVPIPTYNGQAFTVGGGQSIVMFEQSEKKAAAFEFMKFLVGEEAQVSMATGMGMIPVNIAAGQDADLQADPVLSVYIPELNNEKCRIPSPRATEIAEAVKDDLTAIFSDEVTVEDGLNELATRIDEIIQAQD